MSTAVLDEGSQAHTGKTVSIAVIVHQERARTTVLGDTEQLGPPVFTRDDRTTRTLTRTPFKVLDLPGNYKQLELEEKWKVEQNRVRSEVLLELSFHLGRGPGESLRMP